METSPPRKFKPGAAARVRGEGEEARRAPAQQPVGVGTGAPGSGAHRVRGLGEPLAFVVRDAEAPPSATCALRCHGRDPEEGGTRALHPLRGCSGNGWGVRAVFGAASPAVQRPAPLTLGARPERRPPPLHVGPGPCHAGSVAGGDHCRSGLRAECLKASVSLYTPKRGGGAETNASPGVGGE